MAPRRFIFPGAIQIVDLYRAREHLWKLARALHPNVQVHHKRWMMYRQNHVHHGRIEKLVSLLLSMEVHLGLRHQIGVASAILEKTSKMDFVGAHGQPGRPVSSREVRDLICKMRRENPSWGARRIHGELFKFGIDVGESCVCKYIRAPEIQST